MRPCANWFATRSQTPFALVRVREFGHGHQRQTGRAIAANDLRPTHNRTANAGADGRHMPRRSTILALLVITFTVGPTPTTIGARDTSVEDIARTPVSLFPVVSLRNADAARAEHVADSLARFRDAGLALPDVEIRFDEDPTACRGHDGLFQQHRSPWRLTVCSDAAYVLPHELAHAWTAANLSDDDRRRFTEAFGFATWNGRHVAWSERAGERAAFVIQQNLTVTLGRNDSPAWLEKIEAYEHLTGTTSPRVETDPVTRQKASGPDGGTRPS